MRCFAAWARLGALDAPAPVPQCGMPETSEYASAAPTEPTVLDQSTEGHIDKLFGAAVGPIGTDYYLPILSRFEAYGRSSPSWNWAACLGTLNWMLFRGLWLSALMYLGVVGAVAAILATAVALTSPPMAASLRWSLWAAWATLVLLVPGFFGNAWLYRVYRQRLNQALARNARLEDACLWLARQSSTRQRRLVIVVANLALGGLLVIGLWPSARPSPIAPSTSGAVKPLVAAEPTEPMMPPQVAPSASQPQARPSLADFDLQTLSPAARGALTQDAAIGQHSRSARRRPTTLPAAPSLATSAASATVPAPPLALAPLTDTSPAAADKQGPFLINVGLFAQQDNALRVHARLQAAGLPATHVSLDTRNGPRTRVRVGPFASRAQADAAAQQIRALQLDAVVIRQ